jgi:hypothetical protein
MRYRDRQYYPPQHRFSNRELNAITDQDVCNYFHFCAFGMPNPNDDDYPTYCRSTTLEFDKKAISYFIPNKHIPYNVNWHEGNPTKSPLVNDVIKRVKLHEVRGQGLSSQARRDLSVDEFREIIRVAQAQNDPVYKARLACITKFQIHLISRIDDSTRVFANELQGHDLFDFALLVRLRWTKNCHEEQDCPYQIIIGSIDACFCVLAALAIYLQYALEYTNAANSSYLFCDSDEAPSSVKR